MIKQLVCVLEEQCETGSLRQELKPRLDSCTTFEDALKAVEGYIKEYNRELPDMVEKQGEYMECCMPPEEKIEIKINEEELKGLQ